MLCSLLFVLVLPAGKTIGFGLEYILLYPSSLDPMSKLPYSPNTLPWSWHSDEDLMLDALSVAKQQALASAGV